MRILLCGILGAAASTAAWLTLETVLHTNLAWVACGVGLVTGLCVYFAAGPKPRASVVRGAVAAILTVAAMIAGQQVVEIIKQSAIDQVAIETPPTQPENIKAEKPSQPVVNKSAKPTPKPIATPAPEAKPETKPETKPEIKPETKPKSETNSEAKPAPKLNPTQPPTSQPTRKPVAKPAPQTAGPKSGDNLAEPQKPSHLVSDLKRDLGTWEMLWLGLSTLIAYGVGRGRDRATG